MNVIAFSVLRFEGSYPRKSVEPVIDGIPLIKLVAEFESAQGWEPAGGYGALDQIFSHLQDYFVGREDLSCFGDSGKIALLGCSCFEVGCWPLLAKVSIEPGRVTWSQFEQPHREEEWDYGGFGPFVFDTEQYGAAIQELVRELA